MTSAKVKMDSTVLPVEKLSKNQGIGDDSTSSSSSTESSSSFSSSSSDDASEVDSSCVSGTDGPCSDANCSACGSEDSSTTSESDVYSFGRHQRRRRKVSQVPSLSKYASISSGLGTTVSSNKKNIPSPRKKQTRDETQTQSDSELDLLRTFHSSAVSAENMLSPDEANLPFPKRSQHVDEHLVFLKGVHLCKHTPPLRSVRSDQSTRFYKDEDEEENPSPVPSLRHRRRSGKGKSLLESSQSLPESGKRRHRRGCRKAHHHRHHHHHRKRTPLEKLQRTVRRVVLAKRFVLAASQPYAAPPPALGGETFQKLIACIVVYTIVTILIHPLVVVFTLAAAMEPPVHPYDSLFVAFAALVGEGGGGALWKGLMAALLRTWIHCIVGVFSSSIISSYFSRRTSSLNQSGRLLLSFVPPFLIQVLSTPMAIAMVRLIIQRPEENLYEGVWHTFTMIALHEGGLWMAVYHVGVLAVVCQLLRSFVAHYSPYPMIFSIPIELISSTLVVRLCVYRSPLAGAYGHYLYSCDDPIECLYGIANDGGYSNLLSALWPFIWVYLPLLASRIGLAQLITY